MKILFFETVKSKVLISLFERVRLSVSISPRNLYNSLKSIKEKTPRNTLQERRDNAFEKSQLLNLPYVIKCPELCRSRDQLDDPQTVNRSRTHYTCNPGLHVILLNLHFRK